MRREICGASGARVVVGARVMYMVRSEVILVDPMKLSIGSLVSSKKRTRKSGASLASSLPYGTSSGTNVSIVLR